VKHHVSTQHVATGSTGYLVFIFSTLESIPSFPWNVRAAQEKYLPTFLATSDVQCCVSKPIVLRSAGAACWPIYRRKADWIGNWK